MDGPRATVAPPRRRRGRWLLVAGAVLAIAGLAGVAFGSFRLASAATLRDRASEITDRSEEVRGEQRLAEKRFRERARETDRLRDADTALVDGVVAILRSTGAVLVRYNAMVDAFNRSVDAFNVGDLSGSAAIVEQEVGPAIRDVAEAVRRQGRRLAEVRRAVRILEEALAS